MLLSANVKALSDNYQSNIDSIVNINKQLNDLQLIVAKVDEHDTKLKTLANENRFLKTSIKMLTLRVDSLEQKSIGNKLQVNNVPIIQNENLLTTASSIISKLDMTLRNDDVLHIQRVDPRSKNRTTNSNATSSVDINTSSSSVGDPSTIIAAASPNQIHGSIVITLKSQWLRNEILTAYRKRQDRELFLDNNKKIKIYFNEYLSINRRRLLYKTKLFAKENAFKFVWVRDGAILMKKNEGSKIVHINQYTDFAGIGGGDRDRSDSD